MIPIKYNKFRYWLGMACVVECEDRFYVAHLWGMTKLDRKLNDDYWWITYWWSWASFRTEEEAYKRLEAYKRPSKKCKPV